MKKTILFALIFSFASAFAEPVHLKIGAISSLTGPAAEQGRNWLEGAELAKEVLLESGINIELLVEDDATVPSQSVAGFQKLTVVSNVQGVVGGTWDFLAEALAPFALKAKTPLITPTNPVEILSTSTTKNKYLFTNGLSLAATGSAFKEAVLKLKPKKVAIVVPNVPFGTMHAGLVVKISKELGAEVVLNEAIDYGGYHSALKTLALKISKLKPDLVFCASDYAGLSTFARELANAKANPWIFNTQHLDEAFIFSKEPKLWEKAIGLYPVCDDKEFKEKFAKKFGRDPKVYAVQGYDAMTFLAQALAKGVDLTQTSFESNGICGTMKSSPDSRELITYKVQAMRIGKAGELVRFD